MRKFIGFILLISLGLGISTPALASSSGDRTPRANAVSAILIDSQSGETLYEQNAADRLPMASTTKIMTALVALEKGNLDDLVTVSESVMDRRKVYGTLIYLEPGEKISLRELLHALLMNSANDAAVAIAEHIAGNVDAFVGMMNSRAAELGAEDTHFANPHGLSQSGHYSTAKDLALIARYAMQDPRFAEIVKTKEKEITRSKPELPSKLSNINHLLWLYEQADGIKTGYTDQAGPCIVSSATKDGRRLIAVIIKAQTPKIMYQDAEKLLEYGFTNSTMQLLAKKGQVMKTVPLEDGRQIQLALANDVYGTLKAGEKDNYDLRVKPDAVALPVQAGAKLGELEVYKQDKLVGKVPLLATEELQPLPPVSQQAKFGWIWLLPVIFGIITWFRLQVTLRRRRRAAIRAKQYQYYID